MRVLIDGIIYVPLDNYKGILEGNFFGARLKSARLNCRWTLQQLADMTYLSKSHLSAIENGRSDPSMEVAIKLSRALGVSLDALANGEKQHD